MSNTKVIIPAFYSSSNLLNLPLELLSLIVSNISHSSDPPAESFESPPSNSNPLTHPASTTDDLISLSLSHPTFSILAAPYLLRNLTITVSTHPSALTRLSRLAAILRSVPGLERHVRQLKWYLEDPVKPEDGQMLPIDLLERFSCLPNLESLEIHCGVSLSSSYASSESDLESSMNDTWYWRPLYRPNYVSEAAEANHEPALYTAADVPTYSSPPKSPLSNPILNFYSLFTSYIPTSGIHSSLPNLVNLALSGITSPPLFPLFQIPTLESLTLSKCSAILKYDGSAAPLHYDPPIKLSNHSLKHFKAVEVSIYINLDDKTTPPLPWFLKDVETMWLEDFGYHAPDHTASELNGCTKQPSEAPFSYGRLKKLTCAGIIDFHPLVGTGYNTNLNAGDIVSGPTPFPILQEFVFEQTSSYPTDHLCSLYPYFLNLEVLQIGLSSQPQLNAYSPLHQSHLASILSRFEGHLKALIIRRYESASDALETLQELSDALSAPSDPISPRNRALQSIIIDLTLTSSEVRNLERLADVWHRLSSVLLSKKNGVPSMLSLKSIEVMVELVWTPEIMMTRGPRVAIELHKYEQERDEPDEWKDVERPDSDMGWYSNLPLPCGSDSGEWFTEHENVTSNSGWKPFGWRSGENHHTSEEHNQRDTSTSSYASSYAASHSQFSVSPIPSSLTPCFPTHKNRSPCAFYSTTHIHEPHSIEWDEYPTDDELKALLERPLAELVARSRELGSEVEVSFNVGVIRNEGGY